MRKLIPLLLLLAGCGRAWGQASWKRPVNFNCQCSDQVGALYATAFRDLLASSPRYQEVNSATEPNKEGKPTVLNWKLEVVSLDPSASELGRDSVISVVLLLGDGFFQTQQVQWCPVDRVQNCAAGTLSFLDGYISNLK